MLFRPLLIKHLGPVSQSAASSSATKTSDVSAYVTLLQDFVHDKIPAKDFEQRWLSTFQMDATPRSTHEFEVLNSLFGDVELHWPAILLDNWEEEIRMRLLSSNVQMTCCESRRQY